MNVAPEQLNRIQSGVREATLGVVDIGSNTVHLLVARTNGRSLVTLIDMSESLRLGADIDATGAIGPQKLRELVDTIGRFATASREAGVAHLRLLATQAVRVAANKDEVLAVVRAETGLEAEVLSTDQEAALAFMGADAFCPSVGPQVMVDIGGGSMQIAIGQFGHTWDSVSLPLGASRMAAHFFPGDPPSAEEEALLAGYLSSVVGPALPLSDTGATGIVGTGGTLRRVPPLLGLKTGQPFPPDAIECLLGLVRGKSSEEIAAEYDIRADRARLVLPAVMLLREVWSGYDCPPVLISGYGLREGAVLALARRGENHAISEL